MITWRDVTGHHCTADVRLGAAAVARLQAYPNHWRIEFIDGFLAGPANSISQAKRAALEALADALPQIALQVQIALRSS